MPSEKKGILIEKCFKVDDVILVGQTIAVIETDEVDVEKETTIENPATEEKTEEIITEINSEKTIITIERGRIILSLSNRKT